MFLPGDCHWKNDQTLGDRMKDLLTRALDAHGGLSRCQEIEAFRLKVSIGGGLWRLKGLPDGLRDDTAYPGSPADCHDHAVRWRGAHGALYARPRMDRGCQWWRR